MAMSNTRAISSGYHLPNEKGSLALRSQAAWDYVGGSAWLAKRRKKILEEIEGPDEGRSLERSCSSFSTNRYPGTAGTVWHGVGRTPFFVSCRDWYRCHNDCSPPRACLQRVWAERPAAAIMRHILRAHTTK